MNGNIALSLEIGSAYAIQVALLQIPALVAFSAMWEFYHPVSLEAVSLVEKVKPDFTGFTLVFPQMDFYAVLFSVFLLTYVYLEGKSNYFKVLII